MIQIIAICSNYFFTCFSFLFFWQSYSRDLFVFLFILLIIVSAMTSLKKHNETSAFSGRSMLYLNRHQTEEWKGWMQVGSPFWLMSKLLNRGAICLLASQKIMVKNIYFTFSGRWYFVLELTLLYLLLLACCEKLSEFHLDVSVFCYFFTFVSFGTFLVIIYIIADARKKPWNTGTVNLMICDGT